MNGTAFKGKSTETSFDVESNLWQDDYDLDQDDSYYVPSTPFVQKLNGLDPSLYLGSGEDYCTEDNFDQTSAYVNHQLSIYGFPSNLKFLKADKHSASRIVTALYKILQQHLKDTEYKEEMDLNWRRLSNDYDLMIQNMSATKAQLEKSERETDALSGKISALEDELRSEGEKHRYTKEELKSAKANLQYTKTQYIHEARKKEQEMNVLKDKLQKSMNRSHGSSSTIPGGIKILNPVPRSLYGKQNTNESEHLLKEVIEQQQEKEAELIEESEQLRKTLYTVHVELEGLLKKHSTSKSTLTIPYGLPFEMIKPRIESEIKDTLTLLSDQWNHRPALEPVVSPTELVVRDQRIKDLQMEIEKMQTELEDSTLLVQGAQKMIDNLTNGGFLDGLDDFRLNVEGSDMTLQEINDADMKIRNQQEELAKERKKFTAACLDLGKQREALDRAKLEFEESKRTFKLDQVMNFISNSPKSEKRIMEHSPPSSPKRQDGHLSKKRVATSPLPSSILNGRASKLRAKTSVLEVPDASDIIGDQDGALSYSTGENLWGEDEEDEELLLRAPSRRRTNLPSSFSLEEFSRGHGASHASLDTNHLLPAAVVPRTRVNDTSLAHKSLVNPFIEPASTASTSRSTLTSTAKTQPFNFFGSSQSNASTSKPETSTFTQDNSTAIKRLSASFSPTRPSSLTSTSTHDFFTMLGQRSSPSRSPSLRQVYTSINGSGGAPTLSSSVSMPTLNSVKVPTALSKAAANLAAKKSTTRYPTATSSNLTSSAENSFDLSSSSITTSKATTTKPSIGAHSLFSNYLNSGSGLGRSQGSSTKTHIPPVTSSSSSSTLFSRNRF
ncbi:hypothetical protein BGZ76_009567 [Entomortierella beljakovae]|nr:hypothetical protein BGZ76_009567 [Entomortierella beljakovae]